MKMLNNTHFRYDMACDIERVNPAVFQGITIMSKSGIRSDNVADVFIHGLAWVGGVTFETKEQEIAFNKLMKWVV